MISVAALLSSFAIFSPSHGRSAFTEHQYGIALGIAAGIKCRVDNGEMPSEESQALLDYALEQNNLFDLKEYLGTPKAQTAVVIITSGGYMDDKCGFAITTKEQMRRLNKVILYHMPSD